MNLTFYNNTSDPRTVYKSITQITSGDYPDSVVVTGNMSILNPVLSLKYDDSIARSNFVFIDEWGRYYNVDNISVDRGKRMLLTLSVDVLYTYRNSIVNCVGNCIRNEGLGIGFVPDTMIPIDPCTEFVTSEYFSASDIDETSQMGDYYYVLTLKGGAV